MASENLLEVLDAEADDLPASLDPEVLDRILIEPHQEALAEAIAADAVDVAPVVGDLLAAVRQQRAEAQGVQYPDQPAYLENAIGDFPKPIDTLADIVISQNVLLYLRREHGLELADDIVEMNTSAIEAAGESVDALTPD
jgi:hypothetical protein